MQPSIAVRRIGSTAHAALVASGGHFDRLEARERAAYARANGEVIYVTQADDAMHPRTVVIDATRCVGQTDHVDVAALVPWRAAPLRAMRAEAAVLRSACAIIRKALRTCAPLSGLAPLLIGDLPAFPLALAGGRVRAFACAATSDDAGAIERSACALLGLGPGLTPSGDDLVGAALFARRAFARTSDARTRLSAVSSRLAAAARSRTHPIAAALFADLVAGNSFGALHRLAVAVESGLRDEIASASHDVARIGSSSGFDMLAGFCIGLCGAEALKQRQDFA